MAWRNDLIDEQWALIEPFLPSSGRGGQWCAPISTPLVRVKKGGCAAAWVEEGPDLSQAGHGALVATCVYVAGVQNDGKSARIRKSPCAARGQPSDDEPTHQPTKAGEHSGNHGAENLRAYGPRDAAHALRPLGSRRS